MTCAISGDQNFIAWEKFWMHSSGIWKSARLHY